MTWNYRIIKTEYTRPSGEKYFSYALHECYYDEKGNIEAITEKPINFHTDFCDSDKEAKEEIIISLKRALKDIIKYDVLEDPFPSK